MDQADLLARRIAVKIERWLAHPQLVTRRGDGAIVAQRKAAEVAGALEDRRLVQITDRGEQIAPPPGKAGAEAQVRARRSRIAQLGQIVAQLEMEPLDLLLEHEVDHAGDRVRAIDRRRAAGDDVDAVDQCGRNGVNVDFGDLPGIVGDPAPSVDQDQGAHAA